MTSGWGDGSVAVQADQEPVGLERVPAWEQYPWLRAGFSTRQGGRTTAYSLGEVGELNLGWTKEDDPEIVAHNRRKFLAAVVEEAGKQVLRSAQDDRFYINKSNKYT
jgi:hypothetical protein